MSLPTRFTENTHVLYVTTTSAQRLSLLERLLEKPPSERSPVLAVTGDSVAELLPAVISMIGTSHRGVTLEKISDLMADGWTGLIRGLVEIVEGRGGSPGWLGSLMDSALVPVLYLDLGEVFARCEAAEEMMRITREIDQLRRRTGLCVIESVPADSLSRSLPEAFFEIHTHWAIAGSSSGSYRSGSGAGIDDTALDIALAAPSFRHRFLGLVREDRHAALGLTPDPLGDTRYGLLMVDHEFVIAYASPKAGRLLSREIDELIGEPLSVCIDGVDLVTLKHECGKSVPGASHPPFVVSWRVSPGRYEPREVRVDALTSGNYPTGYIVSISRVEPVRRPRTVYRQLADERSNGEASESNESETPPDALLAESLQGTQITRREHEIVLFIIQGMSNREIARHLSIAEVTVKKHLTSVYRKLRITNRAELLRSFAEPQADGADQ